MGATGLRCGQSWTEAPHRQRGFREPLLGSKLRYPNRINQLLEGRWAVAVAQSVVALHFLKIQPSTRQRGGGIYTPHLHYRIPEMPSYLPRTYWGLHPGFWSFPEVRVYNLATFYMITLLMWSYTRPSGLTTFGNWMPRTFGRSFTIVPVQSWVSSFSFLFHGRLKMPEGSRRLSPNVLFLRVTRGREMFLGVKCSR